MYVCTVYMYGLPLSLTPDRSRNSAAVTTATYGRRGPAQPGPRNLLEGLFKDNRLLINHSTTTHTYIHTYTYLMFLKASLDRR